MKKRPASLRKITTFLTLAVFLIMFSFLTIVSVTLIKNSVLLIRDDLVNRNINRLTESYKYILKNYEKKIADWGEWDDTYNFIEDLDKDYIKSNLGDDTLNNLNVDEMLFIDKNNKLVYSKASKKVLDMEKDFPKDVSDLFVDNPSLVSEIKNNRRSSGFIKTEDGIMMYAASLILKSDGTGDPKGIIFFGRYIDNWFIDELSSIMQLEVGLFNNRPQATANNLVNSYQLEIKNSNDKLNLYFLMDIQIWNILYSNLVYIFVIIMIVVTASLLVNYVIVYSFAIKDINKLRNDVSKIAESGGVGQLELKSRSLEVFELREDINSLLSIIEKTKESIQSRISELNNLNKLMIGREIKIKELKDKILELKSKII